jgi:WD40 repeat protein
MNNERGEVHDARSGDTLCLFSPSSTTAIESVFCGDGNRLAVISRITNATGMVKRKVQLWDSATGQPFGRPFQYDSLSDVALARDGRRLATFGRRQLIVWDTLAGTPLFTDAAFHGTVKRAQFDPTGKYLATASGNVAQVWNAETGAAVTPPLAHPAEVSHVVFSPDGLLLLTTCAEGFFDELAAQIWDVRTGERAGPPLRHRDGVLHAAFSPDGKRVVTAGEDFSAMIWDAKSGNQLTLRPLKHDNQVWHVCFSNDGQWVLTAGRDGVARVWDATTGEPVTPPLRHPRPLDSVQFVVEGQRVATKTSDGQTRVWEIPVETKPVEDLALVAQLLSAQHYHRSGAIVPQTKKDLRECWEALRAKYPDEFAVRR